MPFTVLGGYLGAGKTTIVNSLLQRAEGRHLAVLVNDFGEVSIDAEILGASSDGVVELAGGCVCCDLSLGMGPALATLLARTPRPDQILVEVSGVGEPAGVAAWGHTPGLCPDGVIVAVPLDRIRALAADRWVGDLVVTQLTQADLLACTRGDTLDDAAAQDVTAWLRERTAAPQVPATRGRLPTEVAFGIGIGAGADAPHRPASVRVHGSTWTTDSPVDPGQLRAHLADLAGLLRAKGFVHVGSPSGRPLLVQAVGSTVELTPWAPAGAAVRTTAGPAPAGHESILSLITTPEVAEAAVAAALPDWHRVDP